MKSFFNREKENNVKKFIASLSLALFAIGVFGAASANYTCETPEKNPNWCVCFSKFASDSCKQYGGSDQNCTDVAIRMFIDQFGGPDAVCGYVSDEGAHTLCSKYLKHYVTSCPIQI